VSPDYNESRITRMPYAPVQPEFIDNIITVYPVSLVYYVLAITSQLSEFHIDLSVYPEILDPVNTIVYYRTYPKQGLFIPLTTEHDSINNQIVTTLTNAGEIVFGVPSPGAIPNIPILYEPLNKDVVVTKDSITLRWTGKGMYNSFNVQLSDDSTFIMTIYDFNTVDSDFTTGDLNLHTDYYWRVNSVLDNQASQWSDVWSFKLNDTNTAVLEFEDDIKQDYLIVQNYPNPFSSSTKITYTIKKPDFITLRVYDYEGREVQTLVRKNQDIGTYSIYFKAYNLLQGIYYLRLQAGYQHVGVKKMLLIRN